MFKGWTFAFGLALAAFVSAGPAEAKYKVVYNFCSQANCADGNGPNVGLVADAAGNFYGTTSVGGADNGGTVFELVKRKKHWAERVLYSFCSQADCADGQNPAAPLVIDTSGNLYGVTFSRGAHAFGNIFELKKGRGGSWSLSVLYSFCSQNNCADGEGFPSGLSYFGQQTGAAYDGSSPLYGTNSDGGNNRGGLVYSLTKKGKNWTLNMLYSFCAQANCADGAGPINPPIVDASANLIGTAGGGTHDGGVIFKLTAGGTESVLYNFCAQANCADGQSPAGPLTVDGNGNLFGMTTYGGSTNFKCPGGHGCGVIYELAAGGTESTLYQFCSLTNCADGVGPEGGITIDATGKLYGVTLGVSGPGTLFSFDSSLKVLHTFCSKDNCTDGGEPYDVTLVPDAAGDLFGTARTGGASGPSGGGVVFEWIP